MLAVKCIRGARRIADGHRLRMTSAVTRLATVILLSFSVLQARGERTMHTFPGGYLQILATGTCEGRDGVELNKQILIRFTGDLTLDGNKVAGSVEALGLVGYTFDKEPFRPFTDAAIEDGKLVLGLQEGRNVFLEAFEQKDTSNVMQPTRRKRSRATIELPEKGGKFVQQVGKAHIVVSFTSVGFSASVMGDHRNYTLENRTGRDASLVLVKDEKDWPWGTRDLVGDSVEFNSKGQVSKGTLVLRKGWSLFAEGGTGYLRVKEYTTKAMEVLTPKGSKIRLTFGEPVKLLQKEDVLPPTWLVSRDEEKAWLPEYLLADNKAEIQFLRNNNRVPLTMTFVCVKDGMVKLYGLTKLGPTPEEAQGLAASASGSMQVSHKGNAVLFHESVLEHQWKDPFAMRKGDKTYEIKQNCMYYCTHVDDDGEGSFDCIDLSTAPFIKSARVPKDP
ncbi:MAG: hypothetical protein ACETWD_10300 [Desulfatiglandales bacterium]